MTESGYSRSPEHVGVGLMNHSALLEMEYSEGSGLCFGLAVALRYLHRDLATDLGCCSVLGLAGMAGCMAVESAVC